MRNAARACEDLLAHLFVDATLRARFRRDPIGVGREFGLNEAALAALAATDFTGLDLAASSFGHKRERHARRKRGGWRW